jgi:hypothetical protein
LAAIGPIHLGGRDVNALAVDGTSGLAESHSFSMRAGCHLFVAAGSLTAWQSQSQSQSYFTTDGQSVSIAWRSGCPSLTLCRLAGRDPMQLSAAMLRADWLDGRSLGDWHLG